MLLLVPTGPAPSCYPVHKCISRSALERPCNVIESPMLSRSLRQIASPVSLWHDTSAHFCYAQSVMRGSGGEGGIRTLGTGFPVQRFSKPAHSATLAPLRVFMVGVAGFEPATSCSQSRPSNQTDVHPVLVPVVGFELTTYRLQGGCSTTELNRH